MATSIHGIDDGAGFGVKGEAAGRGDGVVGTTHGFNKAGVRGIHTGHSNAIAIIGQIGSGHSAVKGEHGGGSGISTADSMGTGVWGDSSAGSGVAGTSSVDPGVVGLGPIGVQGFGNPGVFGFSDGDGRGVHGRAVGSGPAVHGENTAGGDGVKGTSVSGPGVHGENTAGGDGVQGTSVNGTGVAGISDRAVGVYGRAASGRAGHFEGNVRVTGSLTCDQDVVLRNADCAEDFDLADAAAPEPGAVMVLTDDGMVRQNTRPYDRRVIGVVSGAGAYRPALILDRRPVTDPRAPIAVLGKVACRCDAGYGAIAVGDLLTSSPTRGHAMRADDPDRAFGAVLGKALGALADGVGLVTVLVGLR